MVDDSLSAVRPAALWLDEIAVASGLPEDLRHDLAVCLEEATANLIMHGQAPGGRKDIQIEIEIDASAAGATLRISDRCAPFDVADAGRIKQMQYGKAGGGGNGLRLLHATAHEMEYHAGQRNVLSIKLNGAHPAEDVAELLRGVPAFAHASPEALLELARSCAQQRFAAGDHLLKQGEASDCALALLSGEVEVVNDGPHGAVVLARSSAPALIGEIGALTGARRTATARALTPVLALRIDRDVLLAAGRHAPDMLISVIGRLGQQLQGINTVLGLYAAGFSALERDDFDPALLNDLNNPTEDVREFSVAFRALAQRVTKERRTRNEMASAALIQRAMLPPPLDFAALRGRCDAFGDMKPTRDVGGDFFDLILVDDQRLAMVIGDVCGKGVPASLFMSVTVTALRLAAREGGDLAGIIKRANDALCAQNATSMFSTLFYGMLDLDTRRLEYVICGHNPPFWLSRGGKCAELPGRAPPLGLFAGRDWAANVIELKRGDGIFLFTDGVTECVNPAGEEFGEARLAARLDSVAGLGAEDLVKAVMKEADRFGEGAEQFDDITCLAALLP